MQLLPAYLPELTTQPGYIVPGAAESRGNVPGLHSREVIYHADPVLFKATACSISQEG